MGILKSALGSRTYAKGSNYELGQSVSAFNIFGNGKDNINVLEEYSGYAWKAINIRAKLLSSEDIFVERLRGDKWEHDPNHEFNTVIEGGDDDDTRDQSALLEHYEKSMSLFGEVFWYFSKGETSNKPFAVYPLNPSDMTVLVANKKIMGYRYNNEGEQILFDVDEIMYDFDEDPRNPYRGSGPMQAAGLFIRSARYTMTYVNNFMENNAIPSGVVVAKESVSNDDWKLFKEMWTAKYGGVENSGKTGFLRGTDVDFVKTGMSLGEVDFDKVKNSSKDDIMLMFGVSKPMYGMFDDINRASAVTARQLAALTITQPTLMSLKRKLTKKVKKWYGKEYRVSTTNPVPEDEEAKLEQSKIGVNRWLTINEVRESYGLKPIKGGDELQPQNASSLSNTEGSKSFLANKTIGKVVIRTTKPQVEKIAAHDIPDLYDGIDIDPDNLGCIMVDTQKVAVLKHVEDAEDDLLTKGSHTVGAVAEVEPHITLLYGLLENGNVWKKKVDAVLKGWEMKTATIESVGFFETDKGYAVIAHIEKSDKLVDGHERLTLLPHIKTFSEYKPHMTLAWLKPEADVNKWVKALDEVYKGKKIKVSGINYGDKPEKSKSLVTKSVKRDKEAFRIANEKLEDEAVKAFYKAVIPILKQQHKRVLEQIEPKKLIDGKFDVEEEADAMAKATVTVMSNLAKEVGELAAEYIGKDDLDFTLSSVMEQFIRDQMKQASLGFTEETQGYIAQAITDGVNEGESVDLIAKRIGRIYEDIYGQEAEGYRLERIARTETSRVANKVAVASYRESGVISKKEWYSNPGACDYCVELNGSIISLDSVFVPKGASMTDGKGGMRVNDYQDIAEAPAHPGCRCRMLPVIDELEDL